MDKTTSQWSPAQCSCAEAGQCMAWQRQIPRLRFVARCTAGLILYFNWMPMTHFRNPCLPSLRQSLTAGTSGCESGRIAEQTGSVRWEGLAILDSTEWGKVELSTLAN